MSASDKLELVEFLRVNEAVSQLVESRELSELRNTAIYDTDLAENVAKLVNNTVSDVVKALDSSKDNDPTSRRGISARNLSTTPPAFPLGRVRRNLFDGHT